MSDPSNAAPDMQHGHSRRLEKDASHTPQDATAPAQDPVDPNGVSPIWAPPTVAGPTEAATPSPRRDEPVAHSTTATAATTTTATTQASGQVRGPRGYPILIGLCALLVATAAAIQHTGYVVLDWRAIGPPVLLVVGVLFVVLGGIGLLRRR